MKKQALLAIVLICSICLKAGAVGNFLEGKYEGWYWYEDKKKEQEKDKEDIFNIPEHLHPIERIKLKQQRYKELEAIALENPTQENVAKFAKLHRLMLNQAGDFGGMWARVMQIYPEISDIGKYPTTQVGNQIYKDQRRQQQNQLLKKAAKKYGLFYFYKGDCRLCNEFTPVLLFFKDKYGFKLIPISVDGKKHQELPNTKLNIDAARNLNLNSFPALYLIDTQTQEIFPASFGFTTLASLHTRIAKIVAANENRGTRG